MSNKKIKNHGKNRSSSEKLAAKKAMVTGSGKNSKTIFLIIPAIAVVITAGIGGYLYFTGETKSAYTAPITQQTGGKQYVYPVQLFDDGIARHFEHKTGDITIRYFVLKSSDGVIRAAFDACDVCWPAGKGYSQDGDVMVCRNCGRRFASIKVNEVKGGCNPAPLDRRVSNGKLIITFNDILQGRGYFDFSKRSRS